MGSRIRNLYKDVPPEKTVKKIKRILEEKGISTSIEREISNSRSLFSMRLQLQGLDFGVNGKGVTRRYACASAYAELLERLQNQLLFRYTEFNPRLGKKYGLKVDGSEKVFQKQELPSLPEDFRRARLYSKPDNAYDLWEELRSLFRNNVYPIIYVPFYNVLKDRVTYLPRTFILNLVGSNGMCAGNNAEEALVQGFSEVFERFVLKKLYFEEITPPSVPRFYLERYAPEQFRIIRLLERTGKYEIIVKDCSLHRGFPVLATILILKESHQYTVNIGAFPIWQIALERCLTEAFQGQRLVDYKNAQQIQFDPSFDPQMEFDNFLSLLIRSKGQYPPSLFDDEFDYEFRGWPEPRFRNQRDMMGYMIRKLRDVAGNLFIRDVSFLGFPTYHIVVPGMSEIKVLTRRNWREMVVAIPVLKYICRLNLLGRKELGDLAEDMENFIADQVYRPSVPFAQYIGMPIKNFKPWQAVSLQFILVLIYFKTGFVERACLYMNEFADSLAHQHQGSRLPFFYASRDFLSLALKHVSDRRKIARILQPLYGRPTVERVTMVFDARTDLLTMVRAFYHDFELPSCWDCSTCRIRNYCLYAELEKVQGAILEEIREHPIDQRSVRELLFQNEKALYW